MKSLIKIHYEILIDDSTDDKSKIASIIMIYYSLDSPESTKNFLELFGVKKFNQLEELFEETGFIEKFKTKNPYYSEEGIRLFYSSENGPKFVVNGENILTCKKVDEDTYKKQNRAVERIRNDPDNYSTNWDEYGLTEYILGVIGGCFDVVIITKI